MAQMETLPNTLVDMGFSVPGCKAQVPLLSFWLRSVEELHNFYRGAAFVRIEVPIPASLQGIYGCAITPLLADAASLMFMHGRTGQFHWAPRVSNALPIALASVTLEPGALPEQAWSVLTQNGQKPGVCQPIQDRGWQQFLEDFKARHARVPREAAAASDE